MVALYKEILIRQVNECRKVKDYEGCIRVLLVLDGMSSSRSIAHTKAGKSSTKIQ